MLCNAHAPAGDGALALDVDVRQRVDVLARDARFGHDVGPRFGAQVGRESLEAGRVLGQEVHVHHALAARGDGFVIELDHALAEALDQREVAGQLGADEHRRNLGALPGHHLGDVLRARKTLKSALLERVDRHDGRATLGAVA
ncbi:hypothetical protein D3C81_1490550 [compost metagenome]